MVELIVCLFWCSAVFLAADTYLWYLSVKQREETTKFLEDAKEKNTNAERNARNVLKALDQIKEIALKAKINPYPLLKIHEIQEMDFDELFEYIEEFEFNNIDVVIDALEINDLKDKAEMIKAYKNAKKVK